jgi:hypothetical protein
MGILLNSRRSLIGSKNSIFYFELDVLPIQSWNPRQLTRCTLRWRGCAAMPKFLVITGRLKRYLYRSESITYHVQMRAKAICAQFQKHIQQKVGTPIVTGF